MDGGQHPHDHRGRSPRPTTAAAARLNGHSTDPFDLCRCQNVWRAIMCNGNGISASRGDSIETETQAGLETETQAGLETGA